MSDRERLKSIRNAWSRIAGFAVCECAAHEKRYRITIDYPTLQEAQDAYRAMAEITKALNVKAALGEEQADG